MAAIVVLGTGAYAFAGTLKTIVNTTPGEEAGCGADASWTFWITNVGGSTGIEPPSSVTATRVNGAAIVIELTRVIGDSDDYPSNVAYYTTASDVKLTGAAQTEIDDGWNADQSSFGLIAGPCGDSVVTVTAAPSPVRQRGTVSVAGRLTSSAGTPLAGQFAYLRWHNVDQDGKGRVLGPFPADADGYVRTAVTVTTAGPQSFTLEYHGSGPTGVGQRPADARTVVWSLPPSPRPSAGQLTSSAGTVFGTGQRSTVVSGTGYLPNDDIAIVLYANTVILATAVTDDEGSFAIPVSLPVGASGRYELASIGVAIRRGDLVVEYLTLRITVR